MVKKKKTIIELVRRWLVRRLYFGLKRLESIRKRMWSIKNSIKRIRIRNLGYLDLKFDKHFFRPLDIIRVFLKKVFLYLHLRKVQSCKRCGRDQHVMWSVENKVWNKLPIKYRNKMLCIECFIELYPKKLKTFIFAFRGFCR